ncbi:MAG: hypothetical protein J6J20_02210 [Muribaculaceae bacterium]|nr:hypothetical protein [Muribaculaceae bacterium]
MRPKGTGLVEIQGEKQNERGFFCIALVDFLNEEAEMGTEQYRTLWEERFSQAKAGQCAYLKNCPIYARTIEKNPPREIMIQHTLNFDF